MKIAGLQLHVPPIRNVAQRDEQLKRASALIEKGYSDNGGFDIVLLPEISSLDYPIESKSRLDGLAESLNGASFETYAPLAQKLECFIAYGFPMLSGDKHYITHAVVSPQGDLVCHYNKLHLTSFGYSAENAVFSPGDHLAVFEVQGWRIGLTICYDIRFPEMFRELCLRQGVDFVLNPVGFYIDPTYPSWHYFVITRALENQAYFFSLNRAGEGHGNSIYCPPWIDYETKPFVYSKSEELFIFEPQRAVLESVRMEYPFREDRFEDYTKLNITV
jgi:nitrilase